MSPTTAAEDRADAVRTLTWYLQRRDQTPAADRPDPEVDAGEAVQALLARGWRRTAARPALPWEPTPGDTPADPTTVRQRAAQARAALTRPNTASTEETDL